MVINMTGVIMRLEAVLMIPALIVSLIYKEGTWQYFLITMVCAFAIGQTLSLVSRPKDQRIYARDGFVIVALAWLVLSLVGAVPFFVSGEIPSYVDAFFETVSGFTTTGSSILTNVTALTKGMLFWRSFTHWIGGMGIIVLIMAILPTSSGRSMHIMRAEVPGPIVGKLVPKVRDTAKILYLLYVGLTAVEVVFLVFGDMDLYEALVHSFGTAGTGGFGITPGSVGDYGAYSQWVITIFMLLFGVNFNLYYFIVLRRIRTIFKNEELRTYLAVVGISVAVIGFNVYKIYGAFSETLRHSAFQVASIVTTTGYATTDFNLWPQLSKTVLFILMFMGGCAGSTAGGLKVSRVMLLFKMVKNNVKKMLHPRSVTSVRLEGKPIDEATQREVSNYFAMYILIIAGIFAVISFEPAPFNFETNLSAVIACFNNIGPGFDLVGPASSFAAYSGFSKIVLSIAMLLGRLEIYPLLLALTPRTWMKKSS